MASSRASYYKPKLLSRARAEPKLGAAGSIGHSYPPSNPIVPKKQPLEEKCRRVPFTGLPLRETDRINATTISHGYCTKEWRRWSICIFYSTISGSRCRRGNRRRAEVPRRPIPDDSTVRAVPPGLVASHYYKQKINENHITYLTQQT
nr:uncharacterized protein LOC109410422 [Aedes albopictus]